MPRSTRDCNGDGDTASVDSSGSSAARGDIAQPRDCSGETRVIPVNHSILLVGKLHSWYKAVVTSYHSMRWSLGGTPNSHRVEGGRDPVNPIYRHVWRRARAGLGWAGLGAFMNMNYSQSVPLTATNFLRQQEQSS